MPAGAGAAGCPPCLIANSHSAIRFQFCGRAYHSSGITVCFGAGMGISPLASRQRMRLSAAASAALFGFVKRKAAP